MYSASAEIIFGRAIALSTAPSLSAPVADNAGLQLCVGGWRAGEEKHHRGVAGDRREREQRHHE